MRIIFIIAAVALAGCASDPHREPPVEQAGNYSLMAACLYRELERQFPGTTHQEFSAERRASVFLTTGGGIAPYFKQWSVELIETARGRVRIELAMHNPADIAKASTRSRLVAALETCGK